MLDKKKVGKKYAINIEIILTCFPLPASYFGAKLLPFHVCNFSKTEIGGGGVWEQGSRNYITHFHEN